MRRTRRVVDEERLVAHQRLLLANPPDRLVGHVLREVVALLRRLRRLDRRRALVQGRVVLVRLAAHEAVEVLEATATARPRVERPERARLPHGHLVTLPELGGRVAVQLERLRQRRARIRPHRVVSRRRRCDLRDPTHADAVMVAARQQRRPRRRAQRRRVEAPELQPLSGQPLRRRGPTRSAERARGCEAGVVDQHHQDVRRARRRTPGLDRGELRVRVLRILVDRTVVGAVRNRQDLPRCPTGLRHGAVPDCDAGRRRCVAPGDAASGRSVEGVPASRPLRPRAGSHASNGRLHAGRDRA